MLSFYAYDDEENPVCLICSQTGERVFGKPVRKHKADCPVSEAERMTEKAGLLVDDVAFLMSAIRSGEKLSEEVTTTLIRHLGK